VSRDGWRLVERAGVVFATCDALGAVGGIGHAFSTRRAFGRSNFDLGPAEGGSPETAWRRRALLLAAGLGTSAPRMLRQVHGDRVVDAGESGAKPPEADAAILVHGHGAAESIPAVRVADCVPLLLASVEGTACAAVHAGWRGTAGGIVAAVLEALRSRGIAARHLVAAMGPAIRGCCYDVGPEVVAALEAAAPGGITGWTEAAPGGGVRVDLHAVLRAQLAAAGVAREAIHGAPWCTRCHNDIFFSYRAEGVAAGRLMAVVGPVASP
jgi:YfiH family protein